MNTKPYSQCYWVEPGKILAGEYPRTGKEESSLAKIAALEAAGVGAFIDLTEEGELLPYADLLTTATHQRFSIRDMSTPRKSEQTTAILDAIDHHIAEGRTVYVHCWGGIGRTGVIVGCWLARHGYMGPDSLIRLRELWKDCSKSVMCDSPQTRAQCEYVVTWRENR